MSWAICGRIRENPSSRDAVSFEQTSCRGLLFAILLSAGAWQSTAQAQLGGEIVHDWTIPVGDRRIGVLEGTGGLAPTHIYWGGGAIQTETPATTIALAGGATLATLLGVGALVVGVLNRGSAGKNVSKDA